MTDALVLWTARLAVGCWLARWVLHWGRGTALLQSRVAAIVWTCGCALFLVHVWSVFECIHNWSHTAAVDRTARETGRIVGVETGVGIWFNYLLLLLWPLHTTAVWRCRFRPATTQVSYAISLIDLYLAFIVVNSTVVFGPRWWWAVYAAGVIAGLLLRRMDLGDTKEIREPP